MKWYETPASKAGLEKLRKELVLCVDLGEAIKVLEQAQEWNIWDDAESIPKNTFQ